MTDDPVNDPERRQFVGKIEQLTTRCNLQMCGVPQCLDCYPNNDLYLTLEEMHDNMHSMATSAGKSMKKVVEDAIKETDSVNHPSHYCNREMEAIDIIEMIIEIEHNPKVAYNMSNVLKYLLRFRDKGKAVHDLSKAVWYLNRMIEKIKEEESK